MEILYPYSRTSKKYETKFNGFSPDFENRIEIHREMENLVKKLPRDSKIEMSISAGNLFESRLFVKSSLFGCDLRAESEDFDQLIHKAFRAIEEEINNWQRNIDKCNEFTPYFGGYPDYYKEMRV